MTQPALDERTTAQRPLPESPYKGLAPYTEEDADFFFGRERERQLIAANLMASRLTLLFGSSGVGKTSVLLAGVARDLRTLARENLAERGSPEHVLVVFRSWRDDPVEGIKWAVAEAVAELKGAANLVEPPDGTTLTGALEHWSEQADAEILIVLDQFEDYFLYYPDEDGEGTFAVEFPRAVNRIELRVGFLVSIREDALAKLDRFKGRIAQLFDNYLRIDHLDETAARAAIELPIAEYNKRAAPDQQVEIEPELVEAVLEQVRTGRLGIGEAPGTTVDGARPTVETPFLQLVLGRLWDEERANGSRVLREETLRRLGGAEQIVSSRLDEAMDALSAEEQKVAALVFRFLVTKSGTKIAHAAADLADFACLQQAEVEPVLEKLSSGDIRVLRPVAPPAGAVAATRYEIFHDVLGPAVLDWRGRFMQKLSRAEAEERAAHERRRARMYRALAFGSLVVAAAIAGLAFWALHERRVARSQRLVAQAISNLDVDPHESAVLAAKALDVKGSPEAENALRLAVPDSRVRRIVELPHNVTRASYDRDGGRVLTASRDGTVRVYDADLRRTLFSRQVGGGLEDADLSADGRRVLTLTSGRLRLWETQSAKRSPIWESQRAGTVRARFSPDARSFVAAGFDGQARVWDLEQPGLPNDPRVVGSARSQEEFPKTLTGDESPLSGAIFSPNGRRILAFGGRIAILWDVERQRKIQTFRENRGVLSASLSRDGRLVATTAAKVAHVWNARTGKQISEMRGHTDWVNDAEFRRDGNLLVTASGDGTARVWEVRSGAPLFALAGHKGVVNSASFSAGGGSIITAGSDGSVRVWAARMGLEFRGHDGWVLDATFSPDGKRVATAGADGRIIIRDTGTGARLWGISAKRPVNSVDFSPDGKLLVATSGDEAVIWDTVLRKRASSAHGYSLLEAAFMDGKRVVTAGAGGLANIWRARSGVQSSELSVIAGDPDSTAHDGDVTGVAYSAKADLIATTGNDDRQARIWKRKAQTDKYILAHTLRGHRAAVFSPAFTSDGLFLVTAGDDRIAIVWSTETGHVFKRLPVQGESIVAAAFNPDGRLVATAGVGGVTRIWDWREGKLLAALRMHADFVNSVEFSPNGRFLLTASDDGTAKLYECDTCGSLGDVRGLLKAREERLGLDEN